MKIPGSVLQFSAGDKSLEPYGMFYDYWNHYQASKGKEGVEYQTHLTDGSKITFEEKEEKMNATLKREILRVAGIANFEEFPIEQWASHPTLKWASFAVVSAMVDMILPNSVNDAFSMFSEIRNMGFGDSAKFDIEARDIFAVSKHGRGQRTTEVHRQYVGSVTVVPENHQLTVGVSLYKVLAGVESLAKLVAKVIYSMEVAINADIYTAFQAAIVALPSTATTGLLVSGYTQDSLTRLCDQVSAWNSAGAVIVGTKRALANVLPNDANYRYNLTDDFMKIGYVRDAFGYPVMALPNIADWKTPFTTALSNSYLYILSPSSQKFVKVVLEGGTMSNVSGTWENADLTTTATMMKAWGTGIATSAVAGVITL